MPDNNSLKIGEIAEHSRNLPEGRWWIVPIDPSEQAYWRSRNPLLGYKQPGTADCLGSFHERGTLLRDELRKTARVTAVIQHVKLLIQDRIDRGERYFTEYSNHADLLELRQDIVAHFKSQHIDLNIRKGGYIFVFGTLKGVAAHAA